MKKFILCTVITLVLLLVGGTLGCPSPVSTPSPKPTSATPNPTTAFTPASATPNPTTAFTPASATPKPTAALTPASPAQENTNRGRALLNEGKYDEAIAEFDTAIKLDPEYFYAYSFRGFAYSKKGQYDLAIADYNKAIELDPKNANAYLNRAFAYYNNKQYDLAIADYNKVIELDPKNGYVYNNRGLAYYYKGQYESAIADYNKAIELDPKDADAWNNKGVALQKLGRPGEAMVCYDNALQIDPSHESAKSNKASLMASADGSQREDGLPAFSDPDRIVIFPGQEIRGVISDNSSEREGTITNHVTPLILRAYGGKPQVPGPPYKWSFPLMESGPMAIHMESNGLVTLRKSSLPLLPEGTYPFAVEVTDGTRTTRGTVTLQVERWVPTGTGLGHLPAPVIAGQSLSPGKGEYLLPDAKAGRAYGATLLIFGGEPPYWFQHAPAYFASSGDFFSSGLRIDPTTGVVYGVVDPQVAGKTLRFGVSVRDGSGLEGGLVPGPPERFPVYSIKVIP